MHDGRLTDELARCVMGWRALPERFLIGGRRWIPRWRFQPLTNLADAFRLLEKAATSYTLTATPDATFTAHICVADRTGSASGKSPAATITVAIAKAIGLRVDLPEEQV